MKVKSSIMLFISFLFILITEDGCNSNAGSNISDAVTYSTGILDETFGTSGIVTTPVGLYDDRANAVVLQDDGKIVVAGYSYNGVNDVIALVRYNAKGSFDTGFGHGGIVTTRVGSSCICARAVVLQDDGKIVVAGYTYYGSNNDIALVRYNANGYPDMDFGIDGIVTTPVGSGADYAYAVALQDDGKIVVAGYFETGFYCDIALMRYKANGTLDTDFGTGGIVTTKVGTYNFGRAVAIQDDGKIVVAGYCANGANDDFSLVRYNEDGTLDTGFGSSGIVTTAVGPGGDEAFAMAMQNDGKIIVAGLSLMASKLVYSMVRYTTNGVLDTGFGSSGIVTTKVGSDGYSYAVAIQDDGKIVAAGFLDSDIALVRYNTNGILDTGFGCGGIVTTTVGAGSSAYAIAIQNDGKIVVAGNVDSGSDIDFALVRYR